MKKVCETCDHFPADNHCLGCLYDDVTGGNTKWELRNDNNVIERKVIEDIKTEITKKARLTGDPSECHGLYIALEIIDKNCRG